MGTWGTAIFSDDLALDVKSDFKRKIGFGKSSEQATLEILKEYADSLNDIDENSIVWLALAATQTQLGYLLDTVKVQALEIIENGNDLRKWESNKSDYKKREQALNKLKIKLNGNQPEPKKIPKPNVRNTNLQKGDIFTYKLSNSKKIILRVIRIQEDPSGDRYPFVELLDFYNETIDNKLNISNLDIKIIDPNNLVEIAGTTIKSSGQFYLASFGKRDVEDWEKIEIIEKDKDSKERKGSSIMVWWKEFEERIIQVFDN